MKTAKKTSRKLTRAEMKKMAAGRPSAKETGQLRAGNFVRLYFARLGGKNIARGETVLFETEAEAIQVAADAKARLRQHLSKGRER